MSSPRKTPGQTPALPVTYPNLFLQLAEERGVAAATALKLAQLDPQRLADPAGRVSVAEHIRLVEAVVSLADDEGLGLEAGLRQPLTAHGSVGVAMMCSATAGDALAVLQRFWHLRARGISFEISRGADTVSCHFEADLPMPPAVRAVMLGAMLGGFHQGLQFAFGPQLPGHEIWLEGPEPPWFARLRGRLPPARFNMPAGSWYRAPASLLPRPLATASKEALATALMLCEREAALLDEDQDHIVRTARTVLIPGREGYPSPAQLAGLMHLTPRTLRRRLLAQASSYQQLLSDARHRDALQLLENQSLDIRDIAARLGYADPANFTRAFRAWTGHSPSYFRQLLRSGTTTGQ